MSLKQPTKTCLGGLVWNYRGPGFKSSRAGRANSSLFLSKCSSNTYSED